MQYVEIPTFAKEDVEAAIEHDETEKLVYAVLSAALHSNDPEWAEGVCLRLASHPHSNVRGNAILGFGHIARVHRRLNRQQVQPVIEAALADADSYVRGQAGSTADDVELLLKWKVNRVT